MENSIEEDIERLEYIDRTYSYNNYYSVWDLKCIEILLSAYKRVLKENEELKDTNCLVKRYFKLKDTNTYLQKENDELKKQRNIEPILINNKMYFIDNEIYNELLEDIKSNYTSVQKVKDKIEKLNDESHAEELEDIMNRKNYTIT